MARFAFLIISTLFVATAYAQITITTKIVDRIEYEGISKDFCSEVGRDALAAKRKKVDALRFTDTVTEALERNQNLPKLQKVAAKRLATVLISRVYVDPKNTAGDVDAIAEVECMWINQLLQGVTALNKTK